MRTWVGFVKCMKWEWSKNDDNCKRNDNFGLFTTWGGGVGLESLCNTYNIFWLFVLLCPNQQKTNPIEKYNFGEKRRFLLEGVTFKVTAGHNKLSFIPYKGWWGEHWWWGTTWSTWCWEDACGEGQCPIWLFTIICIFEILWIFTIIYIFKIIWLFVMS